MKRILAITARLTLALIIIGVLPFSSMAQEQAIIEEQPIVEAIPVVSNIPTLSDSTITDETHGSFFGIDDVTNLEATPGYKTVVLKWSTVDGAESYKIFYGTKAVKSNEEYNKAEINAGIDTSYYVPNLNNGTTYYFSVIAVKGSKMSEFYSNEVSATPTEDAAPSDTGTKIKVNSSTSLTVTFKQEMMNIPNLTKEIAIKKIFDTSPLTVKSANFTDPKTLAIETAQQTEGAKYEIRFSGNFKTTEDIILQFDEETATFIGFTKLTAEIPVAGNTGDFAITAIKNVDAEAIEVTFNRAIKLGKAPEQEIAIVKSSDANSALQVTQVLPHETDKTKVLIVTNPQESIKYTLVVTGVTDEQGNALSQANSTIEFLGLKGVKTPTSPTEPDGTVPPTKITISETGPGDLIPLLFSSIGAAAFILKKRK